MRPSGTLAVGLVLAATAPAVGQSMPARSVVTPFAPTPAALPPPTPAVTVAPVEAGVIETHLVATPVVPPRTTITGGNAGGGAR